MNYTSNHHLPQWAESDRIRMEDFNSAMSAIDSSLTSVEAGLSTVSEKADAANCPYVVGSYEGNGTSQIVRIGFQPSFLVVAGMLPEAAGQDGSSYLRYFAITGPSNLGGLSVRVQLSPSGFVVYRPGNAGVTYPDLNEDGRQYDFIAFR